MKKPNGDLSSSLIQRRFRSVLFYLLIVIASLYGVYFFSVALFVNSPLFAKVVGMEDEEQTQVLFGNSWSPYPGLLYAGSVTVAIRDGSITSKISLKNAEIHFNFLELLKKKAHVTWLRVESTDAFFHMKTEDEKVRFAAKYSKPEDALEITDEEIAKRKSERFKIIVDHVELPKIEAIRFDKEVLSGGISVIGKFWLQPGTEAEIGPATLKLEHANWNKDLNDINLVANAHFHPFIGPKTSGSELYSYLDADLEGSARAETLRILNITLRSLGEYGFGQGAASLKAKTIVKAGRLLPGSFVESDQNAINFESPRIKVQGKGKVAWRASDNGDFSTLKIHAASAKTKIQLSDRMKIEGGVDRIEAEAELTGLYLPTAFSGLKASLKVTNGQFEAITRSEEPWRVRAKIEGEVQALAGDWKGKKKPLSPSNFQIDILDSSVRLQQFGKIDGRGRIRLSVDPIDFRGGRSDFPSVDLMYGVRVENEYHFTIHATNNNLYRLFGSNEKDNDLWNGTTNIEIKGFDEILRYLSDKDHLSGLVKTVLSSKVFKAAVEWQAGKDTVWARAKEVKTDGAVSAFGTYSQSKDKAATGVFEGKVIGIPIGVGLLGDEVKFKVLPNQDWYDELKKPAAKIQPTAEQKKR